VHAFNRGLLDAIADPDAAIDALVKRNTAMNRQSNHRRPMNTLQLEMSRAKGRLGVGGLDDARFARGTGLLVSTKNLPYLPKAGELSDRSFLPPLAERVRSLVRDWFYPKA